MKLHRIIAFILLIAALLSLFTMASAQPEEEFSPAPAEGSSTEAPLSPDPIEGVLFDDPLPPDPVPEDDLLIAPPPVRDPIWEDFNDISGHWAETTMKKGFDNGLLKGFDDCTIRPDNAITLAQMITILTRVLGATQSAEVALDPEAWYYEAAGQAVYLGLISSTENLNAAMTRQDAFSMMARAFALTPANPDLLILNAFSDSGQLKIENMAPIAALISGGLIQGFDGALNANGSVTRAEFLTVLYRVAENYVEPSGVNGSLKGGTVIHGGASLYYTTLGKLWFDCSATSVSLTGVTAESVTLKSHSLSSLAMGGGTKLGTLVIDCGSAPASLGSLYGVEINTLRLCGGGTFTISDSVVKNIEITGSNQTVNISGSYDSLIINGTSNNVILGLTASIGTITILGSKNDLNQGPQEASFVSVSGDIYVGGTENRLSLRGDFSGTITDAGTTNGIGLYGEAPLSKVFVSGYGGWARLSSSVDLIEVSGDYNTVTKNMNEVLCTSDLLNVSGDNNRFFLESGNTFENISVTGISNSFLMNCTAVNVTVSGNKTSIDGVEIGRIENLILNASGCTISIAVTNLTDNSKDYSVERILALVTSPYKGDYTLAWAEANDYEDYEKEVWINAKGYSSNTEYLIWINIAMQRVNIFTGGKGNWTLTRSCIVATGAPGTGTPPGVYYTTYKLAAGWTTSTYTCRPVVGFKVNSGYAFHSRLYYPNSNTLTDPAIGFPRSHGCIRMYDEDINFIYDSIPLNTTVVVF